MKTFLVLALGLSFLSCGTASDTSCQAEFSTSTSTSNYAIGNSVSATQVAQSFSVSHSSLTTVSLSTVQINLVRKGTPNNVLVLSIQTDDGSGLPSGTNVGSTSVSFDPTTLTADTATFATFTFSSAISLTVGTTYWLVLRADYTPSLSNYVEWVGTTSTSDYSSGIFKKYSSSWAVDSSIKDVQFKTACNCTEGSTLSCE